MGLNERTVCIPGGEKMGRLYPQGDDPGLP